MDKLVITRKTFDEWLDKQLKERGLGCKVIEMEEFYQPGKLVRRIRPAQIVNVWR